MHSYCLFAAPAENAIRLFAPARALKSMADYPEIYRRRAARQYLQMQLERLPALQDVVQLAATIFNVPIAFLTFLDDEVQYITHRVGAPHTEMPRRTSFCTHAIEQEEQLIVPDATQDPRFADAPVVAGEPHVRFYAGKAISSSDGYKIGTLCVFDMVAHEPTPHQIQLLYRLATQVENILHYECEVQGLKDMLSTEKLRNADLRRQAQGMRTQLTEAILLADEAMNAEPAQPAADTLYKLYTTIRNAGFNA